MHRYWWTAWPVATALLAPAVATAQHAHDASGDMAIGSTRRARGALAIAYDWTTPVRVAFSDALGSLVIHAAVDPGFAPVTDDGSGLFPLRADTEVHVVLVANDPARTALKVGETLLTAPGDRALLGVMRAGGLHQHPEFQLRARGDAADFAEGRLAFRLESPSGTYRPSVVYALDLANGYLAPLTYAADAYDRTAMRCQRAVARGLDGWLRELTRTASACARAVAAGCASACDGDATALRAALAPRRMALLQRLADRCAGVAERGRSPRALAAYVGLAECRLAASLEAAPCQAGARPLATFFRARQAALRPCLLRLAARGAAEAAGRAISHRLVTATCAGVGADDGRMLDRVTHARRRAVRALRRACGDAAGAVRAAACAADDLVSAGWPATRSDLDAFTSRPAQGGRPLASYFPCLRGGTATHDHAHDH